MIEICHNEFCLHHFSNSFGEMEEWNKTGCSMHEVDPEEFKIEDCPALKKYIKFNISDSIK